MWWIRRGQGNFARNAMPRNTGGASYLDTATTTWRMEAQYQGEKEKGAADNKNEYHVARGEMS